MQRNGPGSKGELTLHLASIARVIEIAQMNRLSLWTVPARLVRLVVWLAAVGGAEFAGAQPIVQTTERSLAQDAVEYARFRAIPTQQALRRLRALEQSITVTDRLRQEFGGRMAGISIEHSPQERIIVLLTGTDAVPQRIVATDGTSVTIEFRTGARVSRDALVAAMRQHQAALRNQISGASGMGLDQRTGELVLFVTGSGFARLGAAAIRQRAESITGVPVSVRLAEGSATNMIMAGGGRVVGRAGEDNRNFACTTGFAVANGTVQAITTAAHCPDNLVYLDPDGPRVPLPMIGSWGWSYQDVQLNAAPTPIRPLFYSDPKGGSLRRVTSWRNRASLRAGDYVCHYGETTGYSCAEIDLTDYAPPGDLCGGPCAPMWVTVKGPDCRGGDSGGPVFIGTTAIGIFKGGSGTRSARCNFYYFMSIDFLPAPWTLMYREPAKALPLSQGGR